MSDIRTALRYFDQSYPPSVYGPPPPAPTVTALNPTSIVVATPTPLTITGTGFTPDSEVLVDGVRQQTTFVSATTVDYLAQADLVGAQDVRVLDAGGPSNSMVLTVTATAGTADVAANPSFDPAVDDPTFNPGDHTVSEVMAYATDHPYEASAILASEQANRNRNTLVNQLEGLIAGS